MAQLKSNFRPDPFERLPPQIEPDARVEEAHPKPASFHHADAHPANAVVRWSDRILRWLGLIAVVSAIGSLTYVVIAGGLMIKFVAVAILGMVVAVLLGTVVYAMNQTEC